MEMAISNIAVGSMENLKENMAYVSRLVEKAAVDDNMLLSELAEASRRSGLPWKKPRACMRKKIQ